jgi:hypothetical protein
MPVLWASLLGWMLGLESVLVRGAAQPISLHALRFIAFSPRLPLVPPPRTAAAATSPLETVA